MLDELYDDRVVTPKIIRPTVFMACITIRCLLGILTSLGLMPSWLLMSLASILIYFFYGRATGKDTWKAYSKTVFIYSSVLTLSIVGKAKKIDVNQAMGSLIILEAIVGLTSKDLFDKIVKYS